LIDVTPEEEEEEKNKTQPAVNGTDLNGTALIESSAPKKIYDFNTTTEECKICERYKT